MQLDNFNKQDNGNMKLESRSMSIDEGQGVIAGMHHHTQNEKQKPLTEKKKSKKSGNKFRKYHSKCRLSANKMQQELSQNTEADIDFFGEQPKRPKVTSTFLKQKETLAITKEAKNNLGFQKPVLHARKEINKKRNAINFKKPESLNTLNNCTFLEDDDLVLQERMDSKPHKWPVAKSSINRKFNIDRKSDSSKYNSNDKDAFEKTSSKTFQRQNDFSLLDKILSESTTLSKNDNSHKRMRIEQISDQVNHNENFIRYKAKINHSKNTTTTEVSRSQRQEHHSINFTYRDPVENQKDTSKNDEDLLDNLKTNLPSAICNEEKEEKSKSIITMKLQTEHKENLQLGSPIDISQNLNESEISNDNLVISVENKIGYRSMGGNLNHNVNQKTIKNKVRKSSNESSLNDAQTEMSYYSQNQESNCDISQANMIIYSTASNHSKKIKNDFHDDKCISPQKDVIDHSASCQNYLQIPDDASTHPAETMKHVDNEDSKKERSLLHLVSHTSPDITIDWKNQLQLEKKSNSKLGGRKKKAKKKNKIDSKRKGNNQNYSDFKKPKVQCKYFKDGKCRMGKECNFAHEGKPERRELCKYYATDCCLLGEDCIFMHNDFPCKFFHAYSSCMNGKECKYSHDPLNDETKELLQQAISRDEEKDSKIYSQQNDIEGKQKVEPIGQSSCIAVDSVNSTLPGLYEPLLWT